ncbi:MAG: PspC domain-containing protein [Candidatus Hydrogenedentes bacterium]|nr:PspC domain-containing protein [Candidatus Hydrogenedentota bacterium]MBI3117216.1 PspC domain-containing protein [Candidatus Hydrogenedentota bacterium]
MNTSDVPRPAMPYRSRHGVIFGVCRGLADHFEVPVVWVRLACVAGFIMTSFWLGLGYLVLAMLMKPEPVLPLQGAAEAEFYHSYASSRGMALLRLKQTFENLDRRIQRIEGIVTARDFDWDRRLNDVDEQ